MQKLRLAPKPLEISLDDGFGDNDLFGYQEYADRLASLYTRLETPFVAALDGQWGSGKTTFARQLTGHLRAQGFPVIYFDAFKNDFQDDAFTAIASEIAQVAQESLGPLEQSTRSFISGAKALGKILLPIGTKLAIRAAFLGALSAEEFKDASSGVKAAFEKAEEDLEEVAARIVEDQIAENAAHQAAMDEFRHNLITIAKNLGSHAPETDNAASQHPLIFIVDELDRCRPTFALELLERIKHFFSVEGTSFLLVTNLKQMQAAVRGAYGAESDAHGYLDKFFDVRLHLPETRQRDDVRQLYIDHLFKSLGLDTRERQIELAKQGLRTLVSVHSMSFRTIERVTSNLALVFASTTERSMRVAPVIVAICFIRYVSPQLYQELRLGGGHYKEIEEILRFDLWKEDEDDVEWFMRWIRFAFDDTFKEEGSSMSESLWKFDLRNRRDLIKYTIQFVDSLAIQ